MSTMTLVLLRLPMCAVLYRQDLCGAHSGGEAESRVVWGAALHFRKGGSSVPWFVSSPPLTDLFSHCLCPADLGTCTLML